MEAEIESMLEDVDGAIEAAVSTITTSWNVEPQNPGLNYSLVTANCFRILLFLKQTIFDHHDRDETTFEARRELVTDLLVELVIVMVMSMELPTPGFSSMYKDAALAALINRVEAIDSRGPRILTCVSNDLTGVEIALIVQGTIWVSAYSVYEGYGRER